MSSLSLPTLLDSPRWSGLRVGLLGGTFNPPHAGHVHISLAAIKGLALDSVWWLVTPQNPLKGPAAFSLPERVRMSRELARHPKILVTDLEKDLGTSITYYAVRSLKARYPRTEFVWIGGMDNALSLHRWHRWRDLVGEICMAHLTRAPATSLIRNCPARMLETQRNVVIDRGGRYPLNPGIAYWMMQKKMLDISSTEIREKMLIESSN